ncbi:uncharacterized protein EI90DRAFT_3119030 [Cantharellus anzutake]|uniref:uncharacterized protein n=1 Tax=Cantharellus anzutake TaxID=1750568 RepID=UPI00190552E3|nr:uncharacterized protein EI90DRAFT_3119030 [Cantharellus anzutake]KAF8337582.1 hypothetical protein EI90DRAFT_3119030 [Cantharellus anzutake]
MFQVTAADEGGNDTTARRSPSPSSILPPPYESYEELPPGWLRAFDPQSNRCFYVDTLANPPVSIWAHPFRHPQFLRNVGIKPEEIPDDSDWHPDPENASQIAVFTNESTSSVRLPSFLAAVKAKIMEEAEARAAAYARSAEKRYRRKQWFYIEARKAIIEDRKRRDEWHYGQVDFIPPHRYDYDGPGFEEDKNATTTSVVRKVLGALTRARHPVNTQAESP